MKTKFKPTNLGRPRPRNTKAVAPKESVPSLDGIARSDLPSESKISMNIIKLMGFVR